MALETSGGRPTLREGPGNRALLFQYFVEEKQIAEDRAQMNGRD